MSTITKVNVGGVDYDLGGGGGGTLVETTYAELKSLVESSGLIPGNRYRITDFVSTFDSTNTSPCKSANHQFDIVVTAATDSTLEGNAKAMPHEGDEYFAESNLYAWELKYSLENKTNNDLALDINGKGVILYMKDEFGNEANYDFKNLLWKITSDDAKFLEEGTTAYYYTFSNANESTITNPVDLSLSGQARDNRILYDKVIGAPIDAIVLLAIGTSVLAQPAILLNTITGIAFIAVSSMLVSSISYNKIQGVMVVPLEIDSSFQWNNINGGLKISSESFTEMGAFYKSLVLGNNNPCSSLIIDGDSLSIDRGILIVDSTAHLSDSIKCKVAVMSDQINYFPATQ